jgi:glycosyltransferase involved in cell wall biosynthesis
MPSVSIIIPVYNQGQYLSDAFLSIIHQSLHDWECIVVNDGSTDRSQEVIDSFLKRDKRIRCIKQENKGLAAARNKGVSESTGKYIQFLDADDALLPDKLKLQTRELSRYEGISLCYSDFYYADEHDLSKVLPIKTLPHRIVSSIPLYDIIIKWESQLSIPAHCFLFDVRIFKEKGVCFDERLPNHEDWDCWIGVFRLLPKIAYIDQVLAAYRVHPDSMSKITDLMYTGFLLALYKRLYQTNPLSLEFKLYMKKIMMMHKIISRNSRYKIINMIKPYISFITFHYEALRFASGRQLRHDQATL